MPNFSEELRAALLKCLKPFAHILLRAGVGYTEFEAAAKVAFVDVAATEFGVRDRETNTSRIAAMTGLTRKEVSKIRSEPRQPSSQMPTGAPAADILHFWHFDPEFIDQNGEPLPLTFSGDQPCFVGLANKHGGDIPAGALRKELERVQAISQDGAGRFFPTKREFRPPGPEKQLLRALDEPLFLLLSSLERNLNPDIMDVGFAERTVYSNPIAAGRIREVRKSLRSRVVEFSESVDDWVGEQEVGSAMPGAKIVGVGVYYFEEEL